MRLFIEWVVAASVESGLAAAAPACAMADEMIGDDGLTNTERNQCREAFEKFDKDNSGAISDWELRAMLQCAPLPMPPAAPLRCSRCPPVRTRLTASGASPLPLRSHGPGPVGRGDL